MLDRKAYEQNTIRTEMKIIKALPMMMHKLTPMQNVYHSLLHNPQKSLIVCTGPAGTGKTSVVCRHAMEQLKSRTIERVVITKPLVAVEGEDMGYLPGNIRSKMSPWIESYMDLFKEYYTSNQIEDLLKKETIRLSPLAYCRGLTFTNSLVICDEAQNTSPAQMKMLLTRIGSSCKMVVIGDLDQQDRVGESGLNDFLERYERMAANPQIAVVKLDDHDVCRSELVKFLLTLY
jgi:phosphate starvation-inducible PhoH-like protein